MKTFIYLALTGNVIYILWILYNAIDDGFRAIGSVQAVALLGLLILLTLNSVLLWKQK